MHYCENSEKRTHASRLISLIEHGLNESDLTYQDLDAIVTSIGPGSFTGIRIGLATAKGLEIALHKPIIGVNAFEISYWLSQNFKVSKVPTLIAIDALRVDVFCQLFYPDGTQKPPKNLEIDQIIDYIGTNRFTLTGTGANQIKKALLTSGMNLTHVEKAYTAIELGEFVIQLSANELEQFISRPAEPFYLRPTDITLKSTHKGG